MALFLNVLIYFKGNDIKTFNLINGGINLYKYTSVSTQAGTGVCPLSHSWPGKVTAQDATLYFLILPCPAGRRPGIHHT